MVNYRQVIAPLFLQELESHLLLIARQMLAYIYLILDYFITIQSKTMAKQQTACEKLKAEDAKRKPNKYPRTLLIQPRP